MKKYFDIEDLDQDPGETPRDPHGDGDRSGMITRFMQLHEARVETIKELTGRIPGDGEIFFLWTVNSCNAFTFIPFLIKECGPIDELILATYSINIRIIEALTRLIDKGMVHQVDIFISDSIRGRLPKVYDQLMALQETKPVRIRYAWNHAKVALIRCGDRYFDVEGSGNWGENAQHEQYVFLQSREVFEFRKNEIYGINAGPTEGN